jgi:hypothetical protein
MKRIPILILPLMLMTVFMTGCVVVEEDYPPSLADMTSEGWTRINIDALNELLYRIPEGALSVEAMQGLVFLRNGERLAQAVALDFMDHYGSHPFYGQAEAERTHGRAVARLLDRYALYDPVAGLPMSVFDDPFWQAEYDFYTSQGALGYVDALLVSIEIQEAALVDIRHWYEQGEPDAVVMETWRALLMATRNHLRVLNRELESVGFDYMPIYVSRAEYEGIVYTPFEYQY